MGDLTALFASLGIDVARVMHGWVRVMPVLVLVPAFGLSALPAGARGVMALCLAWIVAPSGAVMGNQTLLAYGTELIIGVSVAAAVSVPLWTASMVGNIADQWRGSQDMQSSPFEIGGASMGALATLFAAGMFFASGAPAEVVGGLSLAQSPQTPMDLARVLAHAPRVAVAVAMPVIVAGALVDMTGGFMARGAPFAPVTTLVSAVKSSAVVLAFALVLPRAFELIASRV